MAERRPPFGAVCGTCDRNYTAHTYGPILRKAVGACDSFVDSVPNRPWMRLNDDDEWEVEKEAQHVDAC
jgi:phage gpG-like protein